ncbi:FIP1[III]-like protein isoform X2 [Vicia villosa]|uniref:FIP1[III]-like protein isoform X2 n=1 Tax=Vicia villosa TaxID=3911 RepID=UPI00273CA78A|nr:FIP1[III]-like protein isoform X2 [Vicia villosa]
MEHDFADDDFGELYADLQLPPISPPQQNNDCADSNDNTVASDTAAVASDSAAVANDDYAGTDSDDGLDIVLNDDDCRGFAVGCDGDVHGGGLDKNGGRECSEQSKAGSEFVSSDAHYGKGGYGSQFFRSKLMKTQGSVFANNCSSFAQGRGDNMQNRASSSGYFDGSFLPWHWKIYGVNIDKLEEKPWRIPGADITDYFNFGFDENTWKQYCLSMPKGRAIQVEDSLVERQPSIHTRRPRDIDSDVVIQIKVHGSPGNNSGSVKSNIHDLSEVGELLSGNNRYKSNSSNESDVLSDEQLENAKKSEESSGQERKVLIPDVVKVQHSDEEDRDSKDGKLPEEEIKLEERVGIDTCSADPCWSEPELSFGDQELSLTSYSDNDSEGTQDSLHVYNDRNHSPLRSHLVSSDANLKESLSLYDKTSKNISVNRKPVNISYYSRNRGTVQQDQRHQSGSRHMPSSKLTKHIENDNNISHTPRSSRRNLSPWGHQFVNYRSHERLQYFGSHERNDVSYNWETKQTCYYGADKNVDDLDHTVYSEYSDRESEDRFRENGNQYIRRSGDKRECVLERRTLLKYNEDSGWHDASRKQYVDDHPSLLSYRESRQFHPRHSNFPAEDREAQRQIKHYRPLFNNRNCDYDQYFDEDEFETLNKSCRMPSSFAKREREFFDNTHEEQFLRSDRVLEKYTGRDRHHYRSPVVVDTLCSGEPEDEFADYACNQNSYLKYQRQPYTGSDRYCMHRESDSFRGHERHNHATNSRNDWHYDYTDAIEEDCTTSPVDECEFYPLPSEVPHWSNNDNIDWPHDGYGLYPDEGARFYEETPRHERHARNVTLHARMHRHDIKLQQHRILLSKRDRDSFLKRSSKVMSRDHCHQTVMRCRKSVDMVNREGKSAKNSRVTCNNRHENLDQGNAEKRKALVGFDDSRQKAIKLDNSNPQYDNGNKKQLQNLSDKGQKKGLDIEEGEIVIEEPHVEVSVSRKGVPEGAAVADSTKNKISQNGHTSELHTSNTDSEKILVTLAKMEKRRERFKQPISLKKEAEQPISLKKEAEKSLEAEQSLKLNTESTVNIGEIKQHRPIRKRRWNGG